MRVIGEDGAQLGVLSLSEALAAAEEAGLDLIEVSADSNPPVARIVDWGKYKYQREKQQQKSRQKSKQLDLKQMRNWEWSINNSLQFTIYGLPCVYHDQFTVYHRELITEN